VKGATLFDWLLDYELVDISIHAPVKGATYCTKYTYAKYVISIHAPVKGATSVGLKKMRI